MKLDATSLVSFIVGLMAFVTPPYVSADEVCDRLLKIEKVKNAELPRSVDRYTQLISVFVNCEAKMITYTKHVDLLDSDLRSGWRQRRQKQHTQRYCNKSKPDLDVRLASEVGWTAVEWIFDNERELLVELITRPESCTKD